MSLLLLLLANIQMQFMSSSPLLCTHDVSLAMIVVSLSVVVAVVVAVVFVVAAVALAPIKL